MVPTMEIIEDIAVDAPKAYTFLAMIMKATGLDRGGRTALASKSTAGSAFAGKEGERESISQTSSSTNMLPVLQSREPPVCCCSTDSPLPAPEPPVREELRKKDEELRKREMEVRKHEEEVRKRKEELGKYEEEVRKREEEVEKCEEEVRKRAEEIGRAHV